MSDLNADLVAQMLPVCEENADEIGAALMRGIDAEVTVAVGTPDTFNADQLPEGVDGPGLVMMMQFGDEAMAAILPEESGLLRGWVREPDITGEGMLNTLAQELSMLVVPDTMFSEKFGAMWVENLAQSLQDGELADGASLLPLELTQDGVTSQLMFLWPCAEPAKLLPPPKPKEEPAKAAEKAKEPPPPPPPPSPKSLTELPPYARHLLKISVPVSVRLVNKRLSVQEVLELGPGAMVSFDKSCDDTLELMVGDRIIARGAAVKVGEHFGLEVEEMTLPDEHFYTARR
ncbi:FliM/FliN family flagellar motor C-terminal domain-containing protein [Aeoliella mucimassa]|uniref:Flagellar motor switch protein n=1 Tax=Aeoliella mucimassa TaxID=2527972 RepID=A0A518AVA8_9BACT|nr:FliM/FliN family flagellar motor C-terminal domain-containing protein [Aeoliella mucimassa]QDU58669.1 flagellar motor switch protein [Aeoliella mucimassa]